MEKDSLHLWCAYPGDLLDEEAAQACFRLLSEDELSRWRGYKFDRNRREYLATHALARMALSRALGLAPDSLRFQLGNHGKPFLDPECGLHFNLSNSVELVVCLLGESGELGVDVEPRRRAGSIREVAGRMFSPSELKQLNNLPENQQLERCVQLWTLKEAYIKARGMGFRLPLAEFSFIFDESGRIRLQLGSILNDDPARWRFCVMEHAEHCIALMVDNTATPRLHVWEARPPFAPPRLVDSLCEVWHPCSPLRVENV